MQVTVYKPATGNPGAPAVPWDPLQQQYEEPDTLFLFDPATESSLTPGVTGMYAPVTGAAPWSDTTNFEFSAGKYRQAVKSKTNVGGNISMPGAGMLDPKEFTIEFWIKCDVDWSAAGLNHFFHIGSFDEHVHIFFFTNRLIVDYNHFQSSTGQVTKRLQSAAFTNGQRPAGEWVNVAVTFQSGTLRLYINAVQAAQLTGIIPAESLVSVMSVIGGNDNRSSTQFALSDLRVSRKARTPGQAVLTSEISTLNVDVDTPTGEQVNKQMVGLLHHHGGGAPSPEVIALAQRAFKVIRTDKMLTASPIKAGAPDAGHPTLGFSGEYSYDWRAVDHTLEYIYTTMDMQLLLSVDSNAQILGGNAAPFSSANLADPNRRTGASGFGRGPISDLVEYAKMVGDLVHYITVTKGLSVPYMGIWNEPDGATFWTQGASAMTEYCQTYEACVNAVKAIDPSIKVGGPETIGLNEAFITTLMNYCGTNGVPIDFISWHYYTGDLAEIPQIRARVTNLATANGIPVRELINGEWAWNTSAFPGTGPLPWRDVNMFINDWTAAFTGASLISAQRHGIARAISSGRAGSGAIVEPNLTGWDSIGYMGSSPAMHAWAPLNALQLWDLQASDIVTDTRDMFPGLDALAATDPDGRVTVLLSSWHYQKKTDREVQINFSGVPDGTPATVKVVDEFNANRFDGAPTDDLTTVTAGMVIGGILTVTLKPRSVCLVELDPSASWGSPVGTVATYINPAFQLPFGRKSHWISPWRAYQDTQPASKISDALGINFNVTPTEAPHVARILGAKGFTKARLEVGWNNISFADPTQLTSSDATSLTTRLTALQDYGIRPLILLNSNHGLPCPLTTFTGTIAAPASAGATTVTLNTATAAQVVPGKTGFDNLTATKAAEVIILSVDGSNVATLSKPLPVAFSAGTRQMSTLKFEPFSNPRLANESPNPRYQATLTGWLQYVQAVADAATAVVGADGFDLEIWNELSFGSHFLDIDNYYAVNPDSAPSPLDAHLDNISYALPADTMAWIHSNLDAGVAVTNGFESQRPWGSGADSPAFLTAISKHPYASFEDYPASQLTDGNQPYNALNQPDYNPPVNGQYPAKYVPTYYTLSPEHFLTALKTEHLIRDISPITQNIFSGAHGRNVAPPGGGNPVKLWVTEYNISASGADLSDPGNQGGGPITPGLTLADNRRIMAKSLMRFLTVWVNKGLDRAYFFAAKGDNTIYSLGLLDWSFFTAISASPATYPGDGAGGSVVDTLKSLIDRFTPSNITTVRTLDLTLLEDFDGNTQFDGDGSAEHPDLYNREVFTFLPFQRSNTTFAVALYVMTRNVVQPQNLAAPGTDPTRFDLAPERYRLTITGASQSSTVSAFDPLNNQAVSVQVVGGTSNSVVIQVMATDSPIILTITD